MVEFMMAVQTRGRQAPRLQLVQAILQSNLIRHLLQVHVRVQQCASISYV